MADRCSRSVGTTGRVETPVVQRRQAVGIMVGLDWYGSRPWPVRPHNKYSPGRGGRTSADRGALCERQSDLRGRDLGRIELFHELKSHAARGSDERDPAHPERTGHDLRSPDHFVSRQLRVQVIGEQCRVEKPFLRYHDLVLVDRSGEERDHHRTEDNIRTLPAAPFHAVTDRRSCANVERASRVHVSHLDRKVRQTRNRHRPLPSPWPSENVNAVSLAPGAFVDNSALQAVTKPPAGGSTGARRTVYGRIMSAEARLKELGIDLPPVPPPVANFIRARRVDNLLYVSGHGPIHPDGRRDQGKAGTDLNVDQAKSSARLTGLNLLATLRAELGSLDRVSKVIKVLGMVNSGPGFDRQPEVMDGFSDLMVEVFGQAGRHARSAVGMAELPFGIPVEIEMIVELNDS